MPRSGPSYVNRIKNEFKIQMSGIASSKGYPALLGATNKPWLVDIAIRRPGRFDKLIFIPPPRLKEREQILRIHMRSLIERDKIEGDPRDLIRHLAEKTEGWSGADLEYLVEDAKEIALRDAVRGLRGRKLELEDFERALSKFDVLISPTMPSVAFKIGELTDPITMYKADVNTTPINLAGLPALSMPIGFVKKLKPIHFTKIHDIMQKETPVEPLLSTIVEIIHPKTPKPIAVKKDSCANCQKYIVYIKKKVNGTT